MTTVPGRSGLACLLLALAGVSFADTPVLEHVVVTADFRDRRAQEIPSSVTVLDDATLERAGVQHLEELLPMVPNLSWSGGSSRPRYFQVRGIGELEQYEGAPNPSVGFLIDDIDFSGIGMAATLFDTEQVEVLRGPQGTRYGANALGGIINVRSRAPTRQFEALAELTGGSDDAFGAGLAVGGPVGDATAYRLSVHSHQSDGFRDNAFLGRDDTNGRDETTARARMTWFGDTVTLDGTLMLVDLDNGYDAFAIDNSLTTLSDKPGKDSQRSLGAAVHATWRPSDRVEWQSITTIADSDIEHSFDGDWGNDESWGIYAPYDFTSANDRTRETLSQEFRLVSGPAGALLGGRTDWVLGVYGSRLDDGNDLLDLFNGAVFQELTSDYEATSVALFGEADTAITDRVSVATGLRIEHRDARYSDSDGARFSPSETMTGGHLALTFAPVADHSLYVKAARGYKAGGFNIDISIPVEQREFDTESLWNLEAGWRSAWLDDALWLDVTAVYMRRRDQQVRRSSQDDPGDPLSFVFFTDNAARGTNRGVEASVRWRVDERLSFTGALGVLDTRFDEYTSDGGRSLAGRAQAHAPDYQVSLGVQYEHPAGFYGRVDASRSDGFFYSDSHDQTAEAYSLVNARLGFRGGRWDVALWAKNLFDEVYTVRGFFFGNEPPDFADTLYTRQGDPRQVGLTLTWRY